MLYRALIVTGCMLQIVAAGEQKHKINKIIPHKGEREVEINIEFSTGQLWLESTNEMVVFDGELTYRNTAPEIEYQRGVLDIYTGDHDEKKEVNITLDSFSDIKENEWRLKFCEEIVYVFNIEMGAAEAHLNFSNLKIRSLNIESGASKIEIRFEKSNDILMEECDIEAGVSKFTAFDLLNANFEHMNFEGGVGDYELFFTGILQRKATIKADISLGSLSIYIPQSVAYRVDCDKSMFCSFSVDNAKKEDDDTWYSDNFNKKDTFLDFNLNAGVGVVSIHRIDD
jgi:hypothetical protein